MVDWSEIEKLQADFQKTQHSHQSQKLSERNCIEILVKLQDMGLLKVLHTIDGKEYITHKHLKKEIRNEVYAHNGRVSLVKLQQVLNIDFTHIESKANELIKSDRNIQMVYGQLIEVGYIDRLSEEVNDNLQSAGFVKVADMSKEYDLPGSFLIPELVSRLGTIIKGQLDNHNKDVIFTDAYLMRQKSLIRGMLSAATKPTLLQSLTTAHGVPMHLVHSLLDTLIKEGRLMGEVIGKSSEKAVFNPTIYAQTQDKYIESFYKQNTYVEYSAVAKLGISDPKSYLKRKFSEENSIFLNSVCASITWKIRAASTIEEALLEADWFDVMTLLPSSFSDEDGGQILKIILAEKAKDKNAVTYQVLCDTVVAVPEFSQKCVNLFHGLINEKSHAASKKSSILALTEQERKEYFNLATDDSDRRGGGKRDNRRKKAQEGSGVAKKNTEGGGGGSGQGAREVKTRGKDKKRMKWAKSQDSGDKGNKPAKVVETFMSVEEVQEFLVKKLPECPEDVLQEMAEQIHKKLLQLYETELHSVFLKISQDSIKSKDASVAAVESGGHPGTSNMKAKLKQTREELLTMWNKARLYFDGVQLFDGELGSNLEKYLLGTVGTDVANKIFLLNTTESMMAEADAFASQLTGEMRIKIIAECSGEAAKSSLTKLNSALRGKSFAAFMVCVANAADTSGCMLKQSDKKKDRMIIHGNRVSLLKQLDAEQNPVMTLHLSATLIFQSVFGCMLHAPGRHVPDIVARVESSIERDVYATLMKSQELIRQKMILEQADDCDNAVIAEVEAELDELSLKIKELAVVTKKKK